MVMCKNDDDQLTHGWFVLVAIIIIASQLWGGSGQKLASSMFDGGKRWVDSWLASWMSDDGKR
jgi:hypothetical protein